MLHTESRSSFPDSSTIATQYVIEYLASVRFSENGACQDIVKVCPELAVTDR